MAVPGLIPFQIRRRGQAVRKLPGPGDLARGNELPLAVDRLRVLCHRDVAAVDHYSNAIPARAEAVRPHGLVHERLAITDRIVLPAIGPLYLLAAFFAVHIRTVLQRELDVGVFLRTRHREVRRKFFLSSIDDAVYFRGRDARVGRCIGPARRGRKLAFLAAVRNQLYREVVSAALQFAAVEAEPRRVTEHDTRAISLRVHCCPLVAFIYRLRDAVAVKAHHNTVRRITLVLKVHHPVFRLTVPGLIPF